MGQLQTPDNVHGKDEDGDVGAYVDNARHVEQRCKVDAVPGHAPPPDLFPGTALENLDERDGRVEGHGKIEEQLDEEVGQALPAWRKEPRVEQQDRDFGDCDHRAVRDLLPVRQLSEQRAPLSNQLHD